MTFLNEITTIEEMPDLPTKFKVGSIIKGGLTIAVMVGLAIPGYVLFLEALSIAFHS